MTPPADPSLLAAIADELPVAIWVGAVPGGERVYTNRAFDEILVGRAGASDERGTYARSYGVFTTDGVPYPEAQMPYERAIAQRSTVVIDDIVIHREDGSRTNLRVFARPLFDGQGAITHVLEAFIDITREVVAERARVEGEARLFRAQRMESIGNLAGGIAHDFNNLLAAIKILAAQLRVDEPDPARARNLEHIDEVTESGAKLTRALLGLGRRGGSASQHVALNDVVRSIAAIGARTIDRRIAVVCDADARTDGVDGDAAQLEQVVLNLLVNARDAMPDGGRLAIRTRDAVLDAPSGGRQPLAAGQYVVLEVSDTGTGIDPAIRDRIFDPYFSTKTDGAASGTGLGLATVFAAVQQHGGRIEVVAAEPAGTTMRVFLPVAREAPDTEPAPELAPAGAAPSVATSARGKGRTVLVVDDEQVVRAASAMALRVVGYDVVCAEDGAKALEIYAARRDEVAAVVLDLVMPKMDGRATFEALRAIDPGLPIVLTTGAHLGDEAEAIFALGARSFIAKPYDLDTLADAVDRAIADTVRPPAR